MRRPLALALVLCAPLAFAQVPAEQKAKPAARQPAKPAAAKSRSAQGAPKAHAKPTPEQIRRFNELEKKQNR